MYVSVTCSCRLAEGLDECHSSDSWWYSLPSSARRLQQTKVKGGGTSLRNATASRLDFPYNCTPFTCKYNTYFIGRNLYSMGCLLGWCLYHIVSVTSTGHIWLAFHGVGKPGADGEWGRHCAICPNQEEATASTHDFPYTHTQAPLLHHWASKDLARPRGAY